MRSKTPLYSLARQLLRPSWNKYNLFNISRKTLPSIHNKTMFQQKWEAKKETRAYHGDHIPERPFKTIWNPRLVGVPSERIKDNRKIPLPTQAYATLERRLDMAIFRALFSSSARQAAQIIVHGKVKINGSQVRQPNHLLKPGDLIEVDPAAVIMNVSAIPSVVTDNDESDDVANEVGSSNRELRVSSSSWTDNGINNFRPKPYMSAFAFVPNYFEVSYETCSFVYLRNPVARPGVAEVPSPLPATVHALSANYYQRGR